MKQGYTAAEAASLLLCDSGLTEWQVGFLAVALDEVAEYHEREIATKQPILMRHPLLVGVAIHS
ncbi:MAG: hypothetical protein ACYCZ6_17905 [Polaromonas sp.]